MISEERLRQLWARVSATTLTTQIHDAMRAVEAEATAELRLKNDAHRQEANALANYVGALRDALTVIANRECADEDECAGVAMRCLRQIDAALAGGKQ